MAAVPRPNGARGSFSLLAFIVWLVGGTATVFFWIPRDREELDAFDLIRARRSCRSFQSRDLTEGHREQLVSSVRKHSARDAVLGASPIRFEYVAAELTVWPTVGAHEFLVAIAPKEYDRMAVVDVGRSLQHVVLDATRWGVPTCWIGPGADHDSIRRALGDRFDADRDHIICVCAVGYKSSYLPTMIKAMQLVQHRRRPIASLFRADAGLAEPLDVAKEPLGMFGRTFEACQWSPSSFNAQPTRSVGQLVEVAGQSVARFDFYASTASQYYAPVALGIWCANWETGCAAKHVPGYFTVIPPRNRGITEDTALPRYDISWLQEAVRLAQE